MFVCLSVCVCVSIPNLDIMHALIPTITVTVDSDVDVDVVVVVDGFSHKDMNVVVASALAAEISSLIDISWNGPIQRKIELSRLDRLALLCKCYNLESFSLERAS